MLCGDFNARTADNTDFIINDDQDVYNCYDDEYVFDSCDKRVSNDNVIFNRGRQLLDLCIKCSLRILNSRVLGDLCGGFTCYNKLESSVIEECFSNILYMKIDDLIWSLSDHCKLSIAISVNFSENNHATRSNLQSIPTKFKWKANSISKFQSALCSSDISAKVGDFKSTPFLNNSSSIETALADINSIFLSAASLSLSKARVNIKPRVRH